MISEIFSFWIIFHLLNFRKQPFDHQSSYQDHVYAVPLREKPITSIRDFRQKSWAIFLARNLKISLPSDSIQNLRLRKSWLCENFVWPPTPNFERIAEILILPANKMNRHVQIVTCGLFCWKKLLLLWFWTNHLSVLVADCNWCGRIIQFPCCCCYVECV